MASAVFLLSSLGLRKCKTSFSLCSLASLLLPKLYCSLKEEKGCNVFTSQVRYK